MEMETETDTNRYAGFWIRLLASFLDSLLLVFIAIPLLIGIYGDELLSENFQPDAVVDVLINFVLPAVAILLFWVYRSATPGKMVLGLAIVDAGTGGKPSVGQFIGRYAGYYLSMLLLFTGFFWVAFDQRKQGFHDKLAKTLVVYSKKQSQ